MVKVIAFRIEEQDKKMVIEEAEKIGLDTASFCRSIVLKELRRLKKDDGAE